jgi:hypothetical protein
MPKSEIRMKSETRNANPGGDKIVNVATVAGPFSVFGFLSDFALRISDFGS